MRSAGSPPTSTSKKHLPVTLACSSTAPCRGTPISARQHARSWLGERGRAPVTGTYLRRGGADDDGAAAAAEAEPQRGESAGGAEGERAAPRRRRGAETGARAGRRRCERGGGGHGRRARHGGVWQAWPIGLGIFIVPYKLICTPYLNIYTH